MQTTRIARGGVPKSIQLSGQDLRRAIRDYAYSAARLPIETAQGPIRPQARLSRRKLCAQKSGARLLPSNSPCWPTASEPSHTPALSGERRSPEPNFVSRGRAALQTPLRPDHFVGRILIGAEDGAAAARRPETTANPGVVDIRRGLRHPVSRALDRLAFDERDVTRAPPHRQS